MQTDYNITCQNVIFKALHYDETYVPHVTGYLNTYFIRIVHISFVVLVTK